MVYTNFLCRVKMEIGRESHNYLGMRDERDSGFLSPRKRLMRDARDFENGSPSAKHRRLSSEHRLSTDSLGSAGDRSSPYIAPHSPLRVAMSPAPAPHMGALSPKPKVSFSIDSIMGGGAGPTMPPRPLATPTKMSHRSLPHQPTPTRPRPPQSPARTPLLLMETIKIELMIHHWNKMKLIVVTLILSSSWFMKNLGK